MAVRGRVVAVVAAVMVAMPTAAAARPLVGTLAERPAPPPLPPPSHLPACHRAPSVTDLDPDRDWARVVLDPSTALPDGYEPADLVEVPRLGWDTAGRVRAFVVDDLVAMHEAATAAGATFDVVSAYRSQEYQERVLERERQVLGPDTTDSVALPGHSEHQLGTTVDVVDPALLELSPALADLPAGRWLARHAHEYGFVTSYPRGEQATSCYEFEPWHLRYVGRDLAAAVEESGLSLREYLLARRD